MSNITIQGGKSETDTGCLDKSYRIRVRDLNEYLDQRTQEAIA